MKCRICGCETPIGTKLCRDCAAARKRAFAATVTQPLLLAAVGAPSVSQPRFAPKPARPRSKLPAGGAAHSSSATAAERRKAPVRRKAAAQQPAVVLWRAVAIVLAVGTALVLAMLAARQAGAPGGTDEVQPQAVQPATSARPEPAAPTIAPTPSLPVEEEPTVPVSKHVGPRLRKPVSSEPVAGSPVESAPAVASEPPPRAAPPPPRVVEPVRTDPLQSLNEALRRCAREEMFDRPGCEQAARSRYCGAAWGSIPQCPIGPGTDHGQ
jgi:hypothetical protein